MVGQSAEILEDGGPEEDVRWPEFVFQCKQFLRQLVLQLVGDPLLVLGLGNVGHELFAAPAVEIRLDQVLQQFHGIVEFPANLQDLLDVGQHVLGQGCRQLQPFDGELNGEVLGGVGDLVLHMHEGQQVAAEDGQGEGLRDCPADFGLDLVGLVLGLEDLLRELLELVVLAGADALEHRHDQVDAYADVAHVLGQRLERRLFPPVENVHQGLLVSRIARWLV